MKAALIISHEYRRNQPSVFIISGGKFYGDTTYPELRGNPVDLDYWRKTTSSDSDRGFDVYEINIGDADFASICTYQNIIKANSAVIKRYPAWRPLPKYKIKRGKAYMEYVEFCDAERKINNEITEFNKPFYEASYAASRYIREMLLQYKPKKI